MKTRTPRRHPLAAACSQAGGFSLLEVSLALAAAAAIGTATFLVFRPSSTVAAVRVEQGNLRDLSQAVETSFGMVGTFSGVTTDRVKSDGLVPSAMLRSGSLRTSWGSAVEVAAAQVVQPNDAFAIAYPAVPSDACAGLASAVADSVWDLRVGGHSVFSAGSLDPAALASRCSSEGAANMVFIYHSGLASGTAVAATPVSNPPALVAPPAAPPSPPGAPWTPPSNPPVIVTPPVIVAPPTAPPVTVAPPVVLPPGTPSVTPPVAPPVGPPAVPPPYTTTCQARTPADDTDTRTGASQAQTLDCPASQWGQVDQTRSPSESRTRSWFCPDQYGNPSSEPWGDPVPGVWGPWVITGAGSWVTTSSTCTSCPAPYVDTETRWDTRNLGCPAGFTGSHTVEHAQARTRSVSTSCLAGTRTLPAPTIGPWSAWDDTGATRNDANTCTSPPAATLVVGCEFTSYAYGNSGFEEHGCSWDPSPYWQDLVTFAVRTSSGAALDESLYRVEMAPVSPYPGASCVASSCVVYPPYSAPGWDGRSRTRIRVFRIADNVEVLSETIEADFSNQ